MDEHEKWLSRRVYHETFSTPGTAFPSWRGVPNQCNCGCAEVWYDRLSPTNWWAPFNPAGYISIVRELVRVFLALHRVLWHLPPVIWAWLQMMRAGYKREVMNRIQPGTGSSIAMVTAHLLLYGIIVPLTVVVWATVWVLSRPGVILMTPLYFLTGVLGSVDIYIILGICQQLNYLQNNGHGCWSSFVVSQTCMSDRSPTVSGSSRPSSG